MNEIKFTYKPRTKMVIGMLVLLTILSIIFFQIALNNDSGLGLLSIELSIGGATIFYWFLFGLCALFTITWLKGYLKGRATVREVVLDATSLSAPKSALSSKIKTINYSDISSIDEGQLNGHTMLNITHSNGVFMIPKAMLIDSQSFDQLTIAIKEKCKL
ncbi:MAG: hypothetical protein COA33_013370 [Fluviicola sp.]|nr:hypothetical protein [Fluviicola sp.]